MFVTVRCGTLVGLLVCGVACDAERPTAPGSFFPPSSSTTPTPPAPPPGPSLSGPSTTYRFSAPLDRPLFPGSDTPTSRYVLYTNAGFSLQYESLGKAALTGSYQHIDGRIVFDFDADGKGSQDGQPAATATLNGDVLEVRYSFRMRLSDFEDAVYRRTE
jgi:hypothetical protein